MNDTTNVKGINIVFWNLRSLSNKFENFLSTVENTNHKIYCITETWLKSNISDSFLHKEGFNSFRLDRRVLNRNGFTKRGGGILIDTKSTLTVVPMQNNVCISSNANAEFFTICVKLPHTRPIYIVTLYRPPDGDVSKCIEQLQTLCDSLPNRHLCDIIIGGDFNIDFGKSSNDKTKLLKNFMKINTLLQIIETPTRPLYNDAIIDLILTNTNKAQNSGVLDWNLSDHSPTFINIKKEKSFFQKTTFRGRSYKNFTEEEFIRLLLECHIEHVCQKTDVKTAWESMKNNIQKVLDTLAPIRDFRFGCTKPGWLSNDLMKLMKDRNRALKKAAKTKTEIDKTNARTIRNLVNQYIKTARSDYIQEQLIELKDKPKKFWGILNDIIDPGRNSKTFKLLDEYGEEMTDKAAVNTINNFFANIGKSLSDQINKQQTNNNTVLQAIRPPVFELPLINVNMVSKLTKNIKVYKSSGMDTISSRIWKAFYERFDYIIVHLYNLILTSSVYPQDWKIAKVVPIPKVANATKPGELRPISLLPLPGKAFEHHIHDNIQAYLDR